MDSDENQDVSAEPSTGLARGMLEIPTIVIRNSGEESSNRKVLRNQKRENLKPARQMEKQRPPRPSGKGYRKDGDPSKNKIKERTKDGYLTSMLPEDCRISTLLRRMNQEHNMEAFFSITSTLQEAIAAPENARYIHKAHEVITESLLETLQNGPTAGARAEGAKCLGIYAHSVDTEGRRTFFDWLFGAYHKEKRDDVKISLMNSLHHMFIFEKNVQKLKNKVEEQFELFLLIQDLMKKLHKLLEAAANPKVMCAILEAILLIDASHVMAIKEFFSDIVDLLVGWHVDIDQPDWVIDLASNGLIKLHRYWVMQSQFTQDLLTQFLEDMEAYKDDLIAALATSDYPPSICRASLKLTIKVFNTVTLGLGEDAKPENGSAIRASYWSVGLNRVLNLVLAINQWEEEEAIVVTANNTVCIVLDIIGKECWSSQLHSFIKKQLEFISSCATSTIISCCETISKTVRICGDSLPVEITGELLGPESQLHKIRNGGEKQTFALVGIYHSLLSLKNVPVLEETYSLILRDLYKGFKALVPGVEPFAQYYSDVDFADYTAGEAEMAVLFLLTTLIKIYLNNSIMGIWALKPNVMDLLANSLIPNCYKNVSSSVQYLLLVIMNCHCKKYRHFLSRSSLVISGSSHFEKDSPTTGHFTLVLRTLTDVLNETNSSCQEIVLLCLQWSKDLIIEAKSCIDKLLVNDVFMGLINEIISAGTTVQNEVAVAVAGCLTNFLQILPSTKLMDKMLKDIVRLCILHLNSLDPLVKACYHQVFLLCPWTFSLEVIENPDSTPNSSAKYGLHLVEKVRKIHHIRSNPSDLKSYQFSHIMSYLLHGSQQNIQCLIDTLNLSLISTANQGDEIEKLRIAGSNSSKALWKWATWQAAQFTINSKLRTPLGKPQETFSAIENAIKSLAREFDCDKSSEVCSTSKTTVGNMTQARLLIDFVCDLDKCIYSASEGCAVAIPMPSKPVRLFFYTNRSVCAEWVSRIRWATVVVAIHSGMPHVAVRNGFELLRELTSQQQLPQMEIEKAMILLTNALLQLNEPEALQGLYRWCSEKTRLRLPWVKAATLQAAERYEEAIQEYSQKEEAHQDPLPVYQLSFKADQLGECLMHESEWSQLASLKEEYSKISGRYDTLISSSMTLETIKRLSDFRQLEEDRVEKIDFDLRKPNLVVTQVLEEYTNVLIDLQTPERTKYSKIPSITSQCNKALQDLLEEGLRGNSMRICQDVVILQQVGQAISSFAKEDGDNSSHFYNPFLLNLQNMSAEVVGKALYWNNLFQMIHQDPEIASTYLTASRTARKLGNFSRAKLLLAEYWRMARDSSVAEFDSLVPDAGIDFKAEKETAKLFYCVNRKSDAIESLSKSVKQFANKALNCGDEETKLAASELALSLAKKLAKSAVAEKHASDGSALADLIQWSDQRSVCLMELGVQVSDAIGDSFSRQLYQVALETCPENAKAWCQFAAWSYRQGRKALDFEEDGGAVAMPSESDRRKLAAILGVGPNENLVASILAILYERRKTELDDNQLSCILKNMLASRVEEVDKRVSQIVSFWSQNSKSHLFYQSAVVAYFRFLQLNGEAAQAESALTATLRLLRLIVKHATSFQDALEQGLATTPTAPWKGIIPQLFSRLNHPESFVRRRLSELLCRLASDAPHLILFPAVVGCTTASKGPLKNDNLMESFVKDDEDDTDEDSEEEMEEPEDESQNSVLRSCFLAMVDTLSHLAPASINQVRLLVSELRRITVLWDELWLGCLNQHQQDVTRRLYQLDAEQNKLKENTSLDEANKAQLMRQKYDIVMKPVVIVLERLATLTSVAPETPHERSFQLMHMDSIVRALDALKNPPADEEIKPQQCWQRFKALHAELVRQSQKRSPQTLKLSEISPSLAGLRNSAITMPGVSEPTATIAGIENTVSILPTKTRPKKLAMRGSDGRVYVFLFKGLEDLHLDERIMQFLTITNTMLQAKGKQGGGDYHACHYSVVPLGNRSGLISWVDGVQPVFSLYKRWQMRDASARQLRQQQQQQVAPSGAQPLVPRPSELFYNKLQPLLAEHNVPLENRKEWPHAVLRQVLLALMNETPSDLLAKELWSTSADASNWWRVTKNYARSVAVMSVIGYIIGLGDRHLDNLLVNLSTGEIVHIDYNVCFEKGQTLRVPEKVPFRMTPNLQTALGVTGVEGIFRLSCEHVLRTMKYGRETLLTLLEAFVYDPLIDWTPENEAGYTGAVFDGLSQRVENDVARPSRRELEREAALGMLSVRVTEMREAWNSNKEVLQETRARLVNKLHSWMEVCLEVQHMQQSVQEAHQQMAVLKEAGAVGPNHSIYSLHERHVNYLRVQGALTKVETLLKKTLEDATNNINNVQLAVVAIKTKGDTRAWLSELQVISKLNLNSQDIFDLVKQFLVSAGQSSISEQCDRMERQFGLVAQQMQSTVHANLELLENFGQLSSLFTQSQLKCHITALHAQLADSLLKNLSVEQCRSVAAKLKEHVAERRAKRETEALLISNQAQLQVAISHVNNDYIELMKRSKVEHGSPKIADQLFTLAAEDPKTLTVAVIHNLLTLNANILTVESAATNSGESLVDLTLHEGEWFLDRMIQTSELTVELTHFLSAANPRSEELANAIACLNTSKDVYCDLQALISMTNTIIAPEMSNALTTEEPSVLQIFNGLKELINSVDKPLAEVVEKLETNMTFLSLELPPPHSQAQEECLRLRFGFANLLHQERSDELTAGQKLLMGFSGLFERLEKDSIRLLDSLKSIDVPSAWPKFDQYAMARNLTVKREKQWTMRGEDSLVVFQDICLLKMLQVMMDVFGLAQKSAEFLHGRREVDVLHLMSNDFLVQPVKRYCAEFVRRQLLGLQPESVVLVACTAIEQVLHADLTEVFDQGNVSLEKVCEEQVAGEAHQAAVALVADFCKDWKKDRAAVALKKLTDATGTHLKQLELKKSAHAWINDFSSGQTSFTKNLGKALSTLVGLQPDLAEVAEQHKALVDNIAQRLKWAAGANPTIAEVLSVFKDLSSSRTELLSRLQVLSADVQSASSGILHLESMRSSNSPEVNAANSALLQLLAQCEQNLATVEAAGPYSLTLVEKRLALLLGGQPVDAAWLRSAEAQVAAQIVSNTTQLATDKTRQIAAFSEIKSYTEELRLVLQNHHSLMSGVRPLLKTLAKPGEGRETLGNYISHYKHFSEEITAVLQCLDMEELEPKQMQVLLKQLSTSEEAINMVYSNLMDVSTLCQCEQLEKQPPTENRDAVHSSNQDIMSNADNKQKAPQERNAFAMGVLRRVKAKLEGRDVEPAAGRAMTVQEQVDMIISQSTSLDNLCQHYEGWTPWV
ncbi:Hypothetical predicted protein [Cloeon dipterum]|uniref:non-specific serine/threonine protein kinase n=1 Tax=Cloeon dipterum TaxID=197152 RepID=A0A8S1CZV1_9INSE|nr:Hypothetical predicted protein [Cloeon dipterum]